MLAPRHNWRNRARERVLNSNHILFLQRQTFVSQWPQQFPESARLRPFPYHEASRYGIEDHDCDKKALIAEKIKNQKPIITFEEYFYAEYKPIQKSEQQKPPEEVSNDVVGEKKANKGGNCGRKKKKKNGKLNPNIDETKEIPVCEILKYLQ